MAHVKLWRDEQGAHLELNGIDFTNEIISNTLRFVGTSDDEYGEVCVDMRVPLSRLDIGDHENVDAALLVGSSLIRMAEDRSA